MLKELSGSVVNPHSCSGDNEETFPVEFDSSITLLMLIILIRLCFNSTRKDRFVKCTVIKDFILKERRELSKIYTIPIIGLSPF